MIKKKKKKKSKVKYKNVKFKLSAGQINLMDRYCKKYKTTRTKLIKTAIKDQLAKYPELIEEENYVTENQLKLFGESKHAEQLKINIT